MNRSEKEPVEIQEDAYNEIVDNAQSELDSHNEHADSIYDESIVHHINIRQYDDKMKNFNARRDMEMIIITDKGIKADSCEPNDTFSTAYPIAYHDTLTDCAINPAGDLDFFRFSGNAGDTIIIDIDAYAYGSSLDSYIYLYDTDSSTVLASNDDNDGLDSKIEYYVLPSTGTYFIKVREYSHPNQGGSDYWYDIALFDTFRVTGALSGTITDQYGNPLENIDLDIYTENDGYVSNSAYTDSN
ncbi:MAG: pre-peptidase C-terminal domain-containing protein, partial [candidate division WOR-3 bacterium]|nr:pre-peptidase C-terminal domain-containing protein [candidate division WOR-3 bacterium]